MSPITSYARFPNESRSYRTARNALLKDEAALRRLTEAVAAKRRKLPAGGAIPTDYAFTEMRGGAERTVRLSQLFASGKNTLVVYSYMFGPEMSKPCPLCTSILDALDSQSQHITQRVNLVAIAKSPIARISNVAKGRGWRFLRVLSSSGTTYNHDYHAETEDGDQLPALNVFVKQKGKVRHSYSTELLYGSKERGQDFRHVDLIWPLWNVFDFTPDGRGEGWYPSLTY